MSVNTFPLTLLTPQGAAFNDNAVHASVPGIEGFFGIMANHAPMVSVLGKGLVVIRPASGGEVTFQVDYGVVEIDVKHQVVILADHAVTPKLETAAA